MLRITKIADYGVVVMACFARQSAAPVLSAAAIAVQTGLPAPTVSKILKVLAHAGLVTSTRGARGGYRLSRAATDISVAEVIESLEGPLAITECADPLRDSCEQECCELRGYWPRVNDIIRGALANVSIAEISGATVDAPEEAIETASNAASSEV